MEYGEVEAFIDEEELTQEVKVETKCNAMANKNQLVVFLIPSEYEGKFEQTSIQPNLGNPRKIWNEFRDSKLDWLKSGDEGLVTNVGRRYLKEMF